MAHARALWRVGCCCVSAGTPVGPPGVAPLSPHATALPGSTPCLKASLSVQAQVKSTSYQITRFEVWSPVALVHLYHPKGKLQTHEAVPPLPQPPAAGNTVAFCFRGFACTGAFLRRGVPRWASFHDWLLSLSIMSSGSSRAAGVSSALLFGAE